MIVNVFGNIKDSSLIAPRDGACRGLSDNSKILVAEDIPCAKGVKGIDSLSFPLLSFVLQLAASRLHCLGSLILASAYLSFCFGLLFF